MPSIVAGIYLACSRLLARLGARRSIQFGRALGLFAFYFVPIRRSVVLENLARAFPEKSRSERWRIARESYRQLGRIVAECIFMPSLKPAEIAKLVRMRNVELLEALIAEGKGVIFCMAHMGNWELIGHEGHRRGYLMYGITKTLKGVVNQQIHASRKGLFVELASKNSFDQGVEALRNQGTLALIIDQHRAGAKAVTVEFFGRPAATSPSPALFHLRSGAPVVTGWMTLGDDDVYDIWVRGPYEVPDAPTLPERLQLHTQWLARDLETVIRQHPFDWYWVHRRWKLADDTPVPMRDAPHPASPALPERTVRRSA